ncbi:prephenate dehydratase [Polluticaenibacter yanchengensis]|uniref:prephenate dehydratase n=1 Tax=Polluticaenibacter yanchengensis TaxID=3014562 RepID=A0ABT4UPU2_9BACT|nr:prephenate dehydratase [Chitinophagaceae bacterium LY-5]
MKKVSIQGYEGSFHQEAARVFLGRDVEVVACDTFRQVIKNASDSNICDGAVMAIENSIAGSILPNYTLLQNSDLTIIGEVYLQIRQQLMANQGVTIEQVVEVHSHHMALLQCMDFLEKYPHIKLVESEDTALSAKKISNNGSKRVAAIASPIAAEIYGLDIIAPDIHTLKNNYTRFLVLQPKDKAEPVADANKATIYFSTQHKSGQLAKVLSAIAIQGINLTKLQSMPIPGSNFKYQFNADMIFRNREHLMETLKDIEPYTEHIEILGIYKNGNLLEF